MIKIKSNRKWVICFLLLGIKLQVCVAQFSVSSQVPAAGLFTKSQLWNLLVINHSNLTTSVKVQLSLQDLTNRQTLLTGVTGLITVAPGTKMLQFQQVQPIQYNYQGGNIDRSAEGFLPAGTYEICYELIQPIHESSIELAQDCVTIDVEPMSPPLLTSPEDQSVTDYLRPFFTWLPPTPSSMFFNLNYDFILSPQQEGQSAMEAVQFNLPIYSTANLVQHFLQYPPGIPALDSGKTYAWQVVAKDQSRYASKSEAWSFTCRKDSVATIIDNTPYIKITTQPSAPLFVHEGILKAEYYNESTDTYIKLTIANIKEPNLILASFDINVTPGQNFFIYDLNRKIHLKESECYEVRISNVKQNYMMRFYPKYYKK